MNPVYDLVLFDLDGTLTKSDPGITSSVKEALDEMGLPVPQNLRRFIGPPLSYSFQTFCGMTEEQITKGIEIYRGIYNKKGIFNNSVYPGMLDLLQMLRGSGSKVGVATSKPLPQAQMVLEHFHIAPFLDYISGADEDERSSTKAGLIEQAVAACKIEKSRTVMIGDTRYDAEGARLTGVDFIGVLFGYGTKEEMEHEIAGKFANSADELKNLLIR